MIEFAVTGMTLQQNNVNVICTIAIIGSPSEKTKAEGKYVYLDNTIIRVTNITVPTAGATVPDPGPYDVPLNATTIKNKSENKYILRKNDESDTINAIPKIPRDGPDTPYPVSFKVVIVNSNQIKVVGN